MQKPSTVQIRNSHCAWEALQEDQEGSLPFTAIPESGDESGPLETLNLHKLELVHAPLGLSLAEVLNRTLSAPILADGERHAFPFRSRQ